MPAITVIGPGAIGDMIAAQLCQDPRNDVTVVVRTPFSKLLLDKPDGANCSGNYPATRAGTADRAEL